MSGLSSRHLYPAASRQTPEALGYMRLGGFVAKACKAIVVVVLGFGDPAGRGRGRRVGRWENGFAHRTFPVGI